MAISPVNISRITHNLRADLLIGSLQRSQLEVFTEQSRIATGRQFVTPSENPVLASQVLDLTRSLQQQDQFSANLRHGDNTLSAADEALTEVNSLLIEAATIASENVSNLTSAAEREAVAELVAGIRIQLQNVGNRQFGNRFLFAGRDTLSRPFVEALGGVAYVGDTGDLITRAAQGQDEVINVTGDRLFGALSSRIASTANLAPSLSPNTRLEDLNGAAGQGVRLGTLVINEQGGVGVLRIDLTGADTLDAVVVRINDAAAAAGTNISASLSGNGLTIQPGSNPITVTDVGTGRTAADLGILTTTPTTASITGLDLGARLTRLTPVSALAAGAGIDLDSGLVITNGPHTATIDLSTANTVQDVINLISGSGAYVLARINEAGTGIDLFNQVSGTTLSIGENGGTTATDLGLRTFNDATPLTALNDGYGVVQIDGADDLRITTSGGGTVDVNLDGAKTISDVITLINDAAAVAGVNVTASLAATGNGIRISEGGTAGSGTLSVTGLNASQAALDLGFADATIDANGDLIAQDRNLVRTQGVLDVLVQLESALRGDDTRGIALSAERLDPFTKEVTRIHGVVGARAQALQSKLQQTQDAAGAAQVFLSDLQGVDYAEAITRMQQAITQLQAGLQSSSTVLNLSILDYLQ